jgi:hypothetical protein
MGLKAQEAMWGSRYHDEIGAQKGVTGANRSRLGLVESDGDSYHVGFTEI